ncbi:hypothetical protein [Phenylobacterium sp. J367]|uniref:hypothetical protein n=1 Tax=Phenylobacterium sp. J367 TaxID=2898435 RepID=UPI002150B7D4|nr:hypothetical protein [Phenylobacterium sp. J367]MCR5881192.1 hypothetical protein [Phenylobacterium sp. J367]
MSGRRENARRRAANLFATDPAAAEQEFLRIGDMRSAEAVRKRREERETKDRQGLVNVVTQTKGPGVAAQKAAQVGEFDLAKSLMEMDKAQRAQVAEITDTAAAILCRLQGRNAGADRRRQAAHRRSAPGARYRPGEVRLHGPGAVQGLINESLGVKDLIAQPRPPAGQRPRRRPVRRDEAEQPSPRKRRRRQPRRAPRRRGQGHRPRCVLADRQTSPGFILD